MAQNRSTSKEATKACPNCHAANEQTAQFCINCGTSYSTAQQPPPQPPPRDRGIDFSQFTGSGPQKQAYVNMDVAEAFNHAMAAIQNAGGVIEWQAPPQSAKFFYTKRDFWNTGGKDINYRGELTVMPAGAGRSLVKINLKVEWASMGPLLLAAVGGSFMAVIFFPIFASYLLIIMLLFSGYFAFQFSSKVPNAMMAKVLKKMPVAPAQPVTVDAVQSTQESKMTANSSRDIPPQPEDRPSDTMSIAERIKQLASLRDCNGITEQDYEKKKAALLEQL